MNRAETGAGLLSTIPVMTQAGPTQSSAAATPAASPSSVTTGVATEPGSAGAGIEGIRPVAVSVGLVVVAAAIQWVLVAVAGSAAVFVPFAFAVLGAAWYGGRAGGTVASLLSGSFVAVLFVDPLTSVAARLIWFAVFTAAGLGVTALIEAYRAAAVAAELHAAEAEDARRRLEEEKRLDSESRIQAERAAREREARFQLMVESVADYAIFMLDPGGRVTSWNAGAERITGYTAGEVIGRNFSMIYPATDQRAGKPAGILRAALRDGRHEDDGWRVRKDGTRLWANVVISPMRADGELLGFVKVVRDLSHRHSSDVLLESVLDGAIDGIIGIDELGTIRSFNAAAERMFDYQASEVVGLQFSILMPEPYRTNGIEYLSRYVHKGHARIVGRGRQLIGLRGDGTTFPLELAVSEFILEDKRFFTGIVRDITRQRALEEQLQQAQKMQAIGQLAGGVAHDFNNLLTIIAGHTELLLGRHREPDDLNRALSDIRDAGMRAAGLTRQLLAFSRRAVLEPKVLSLNDVVRDTQKLLRRIIAEDVEIVTRLAPKLRRVSVDQSQIGQVLINLVVNARDAVADGGTIEIRTANCDVGGGGAASGRGVLLSVRDNGSGIPAEIMQRIFEPFFTTKPTGAGTGLGLSMVHGIVTQSGGRVEVSSELGVGSEFRVILPAAEAPAEAVAAPGRQQRAADESVAGTETLLVVEDEESVRRLAVLALREHGYRVMEASNGAEALRLLGGFEGTVDLVVTDVVMPVMGGRQLVEALKTLRADARVLYVSGYTDDAVIRHGVQRADVSFLQKPYSPHALAAKVRSVLDGRD